jgi:hypothetical protein
MIDHLISVISREAAAFDSYLTLLEQQKAALVANDLECLSAITEQLRDVVVQTRLLGREREKTIEQIRSSHDIDGNLTLSRLLDLVDDTRAVRLTRLQELILSLNDQITDVRNTNAMLLNQSRKSITSMMIMLARIQHPDNTYSRTGSDRTSEAAMAVDRRA